MCHENNIVDGRWGSRSIPPFAERPYSVAARIPVIGRVLLENV